MIRVVLDTNVLVSAMISPFGNESLVLRAVQLNKIVPCFSEKMIEEYRGVLARPKFSFAPDEIDGLIRLLQAKGLTFKPRAIKGASPDPKDDDFIACALAAEAAFLVTGNKRHFPVASCGETQVVSARELLDFVNMPRSR
jgi:putative PIN family toxin of toxin-antitoxin system